MVARMRIPTRETQALIIGGGATGTGVLRDLALRGIDCMLVEQRDVTAGASGANHGLLHSGGRYVFSDPESAAHCRSEGELLKRLAPHLIEDTGGLFVAVQGDDESYVADFPLLCERCGIPVQRLDPAEARELEPSLSERLIAAYAVPDASIDPFKLALENIADAERHGATVLAPALVERFHIEGRRIRFVVVRDPRTGVETRIEAAEVVNAAGAWSGEITAMAGLPLNVLFSKGTLLISQRRVARRVINRLRKPSNADIIVPGGTVSVLGTTSIRIPSLDDFGPTVAEVDLILDECAAMAPVLAESRIIRAFAGVRPLVSSGSSGDDRAVSRGMTLIDHGRDGVHNLVTITSGKLTTFRDMAEKTADVVAGHLGVSTPGRTRHEPLVPSRPWTVPNQGPRAWLERRAGDELLCECEMVPRSAIEEIADSLKAQGVAPSLLQIALRSRVGKGSCQGAWCSLRVLAYLAASELGPTALPPLTQLRELLEERWKGEHPVTWGTQLGQVELKEALHCGLLGLELRQPGEEGS